MAQSLLFLGAGLREWSRRTARSETAGSSGADPRIEHGRVSTRLTKKTKKLAAEYSWIAMDLMEFGRCDSHPFANPTLLHSEVFHMEGH